MTIEPGELRGRVRALMPRAREDLARLVACRSVADPRQFPPEECLKAAEIVVRAFADAGLGDARLEYPPDGHPAVYAHAPAPAGAPTVLLYSHYDVQPPLDERAWSSPPFDLTERGGRWYGRGAADCKGNLVMHLTALRALERPFPVGIKVIVEGAEEQMTGGIEAYAREHPDVLRADAIVVADAGNFAVGEPTLTTTLRGLANVVVTVRALDTEAHSGMFGGPAPDALTALVRMLATLHDARGNTSVAGLDATAAWDGVDYPAERFRADAKVLDGVDLVGDGAVQDMLWARPAITVLGIDCPPVVGSTPSVHALARARISLRVPPGVDAAHAQDALVAHLEAVAPWNVRLEVEREPPADAFAAPRGGPAERVIGAAMAEAFGREVTSAGQGASIPLCNVLRETFPDAEIMLLGVEEPLCLIHAPNESVDPREIERIALAEALFLSRYGSVSG